MSVKKVRSYQRTNPDGTKTMVAGYQRKTQTDNKNISSEKITTVVNKKKLNENEINKISEKMGLPLETIRSLYNKDLLLDPSTVLSRRSDIAEIYQAIGKEPKISDMTRIIEAGVQTDYPTVVVASVHGDLDEIAEFMFDEQNFELQEQIEKIQEYANSKGYFHIAEIFEDRFSLWEGNEITIDITEKVVGSMSSSILEERFYDRLNAFEAEDHILQFFHYQ